MSKFVDHDKELLYQLYQEHTSNEWPKIAEEYNKKVPGKEKDGVVEPWTKEKLQKVRNNAITHGKWGPPKKKARLETQCKVADGNSLNKTGQTSESFNLSNGNSTTITETPIIEDDVSIENMPSLQRYA